MKDIFYFNEDVDFTLPEQNNVSTWIEEIIQLENKSLQSLNYIFCSDEFLLKINQDYLQHDFYTDIITFDQSEDPDQIEGEIYISIDRVKENSEEFNKPFQSELHRVMIHGVLHLIGYGDHTDIEKEQMRKKEEACLSLRKF